MVFQNYALYPYLTVAANIAFPLRIARVPKAEREDARTSVVAELLGLTPYLERKPGQLSGGQRQRVAMGRAIIREPSVFLMDEPLSNLDAKLRVQMRAEIAALQSRLDTTTVYVTHDQSEAMTLGHRVAVLADGRLQQCDTPRALYERPANIFVAGFIGSPAMNLCHGALPRTARSRSAASTIPVPARAAGRRAGRRAAARGARARRATASAAEVEVVEEIGADAYVFAAADFGKLVARVEAKRAPERGARIRLRPKGAEAHFFDPATGGRIQR